LLDQLDDLTPNGMREKWASRKGIIEPRGLKERAVDPLAVRKLGFGPLKNAGDKLEEV